MIKALALTAMLTAALGLNLYVRSPELEDYSTIYADNQL